MSAEEPVLAGDGWAQAPLVGDGFDAPSEWTAEPVDYATGEVLQPYTTGDVVDPLLGDPRALLPSRLGWEGARAVELFRDPEGVRLLADGARVVLLDRLHALGAQGRAQRHDGPATPASLQPELALLADAHDTLDAIAAVFTTGAREARAMAGEVAHELADDPRKGTTSVRVGDGHGGSVKVTRTQPTEPWVDAAEIVDVIVAHRLGLYDDTAKGGAADDDAFLAYAAGARDGIAAYQQVVAAHTFKTTALEALERTLENAGEDALAIRLGHAYGRRSKGNPQVKIERPEPKASDGGVAD